MGDRMSYELAALTAADCQHVREWRNREDVRLGLRTPYVLTQEMQERFYDDVVCDPRSGHRFWAVREVPERMGLHHTHHTHHTLPAMVGLSPVSWENGSAEISLVVNPHLQSQGVGAAAVQLVLREAFERLRLVTVTGECYLNNPAVDFWKRQIAAWPVGACGVVTLPRRKFWNGRLYDSLYFWFGAEGMEQMVA